MDKKVERLIERSDEIPYLTKEEAERISGLPPPDKVDEFLEANYALIINPVTAENMRLAKKILLHDNLYSMAPACRLDYVKQMMRLEKLDQKLEPDPHHVATLMQAVYGVDMNIGKEEAAHLLIGMVVMRGLIKEGVFKADEDGYISLSQEKEEEIRAAKEEFPRDPSLEIMEKIQDVVAEEIHEISDLDQVFETMSLLGVSSERDSPEALKYTEAVSKAYKKVFGEAEKGRYVCPVDKEVISLCKEITEAEIGKELPEFKVLIDTKNPFPYHAREGICIPNIHDTIALTHSISTIMPMLVMEDKADDRRNVTDIAYFVRNRNECFKKMCWETGVQSRVMEKCTEACSSKLLGSSEAAANRFAKEYMEDILSRSPPLEPFMNIMNIRAFGLQNMAEHHVYYAISYPVGWAYVRKIGGGRLRRLIDKKRPWEDRSFGWNSSLKGEEREFVRKALERQRTFSREINADTKIVEALGRAYDGWEKLWLKE